MSDKREYRKFTVQQKAELVLASFRGDRSIAGICREHDISACERFDEGVFARASGGPVQRALPRAAGQSAGPAADEHVRLLGRDLRRAPPVVGLALTWSATIVSPRDGMPRTFAVHTDGYITPMPVSPGPLSASAATPSAIPSPDPSPRTT